MAEQCFLIFFSYTYNVRETNEPTTTKPSVDDAQQGKDHRHWSPNTFSGHQNTEIHVARRLCFCSQGERVHWRSLINLVESLSPAPLFTAKGREDMYTWGTSFHAVTDNL